MHPLRIPYQIALAASRWTLPRRGQGTAWARNSFVLGTWVPLLSDLDLTVLDACPPTRLSTRASRLKRAFPFLGEIHHFIESDLPALAEIGNPWELARDPRLLAEMEMRGIRPGQPFDRPHAAAFLCRMLEADNRNLESRPARRRLKWDSHFRSVQARFAGDPLIRAQAFDPAQAHRSILALILALAQIEHPGAVAQAIESLEFYFEAVRRGMRPESLRRMASWRPWWLALLPHCFLGYSAIFPRLDPVLGEIFAAQVRWELFGLSARLPFVPRAETLAHCARLEDLLRLARDQVAPLQRTELATILAQARARVEQRAT